MNIIWKVDPLNFHCMYHLLVIIKNDNKNSQITGMVDSFLVSFLMQLESQMAIAFIG